MLCGALCALVLGCQPEDANVGGSWACPPKQDQQCFFYDSGLKADTLDEEAAIRAEFDAAEDPDASKAPRIAYPLDETTEPTNIFDLDIQWHRLDGAQKIFRIRVESPSLPWGRYDLYTQCFPANDGCHYSVPDAEDGLLWYFNVLLPLKGQDAVLTVAGSAGNGAQISVSPPVHIRVSQTSVPGGLYYWSAHPPGAPPGSPDQGTTYRLAIGARTAAPYIRPGKENPDTCEGCHAVSRNGNKIAFTATDSLDRDGPEVGSFFSADTSAPLDRKVSPDMPQSATIALNNDGSLAVIGRGNELWLRHTDDSVPEAQIDPAHLGQEGQGYFPDFSPDGNRIAVTLSDHPDSPWAVSTGSIATLEFDGTNFSDAQVLVPMTDQEFHFYPSWSPDGNWIVFASAPRGDEPPSEDPQRCMDPTMPCPIISYDQPNARLRVAHFPDGRVYDLNRATQGVGFTSTMPKFATTVADRVNEMFITFNSKMPYGIEVPSNVPAQLWLSVLDFDRLPDDPSSAPVWLPFQNFGQKNHLAYWTDNVPCRQDLTDEEQCGPDESCCKLGECAGTCTPNTLVK